MKSLLTVTIWAAFIGAWVKLLTVFIFQGLMGGATLSTEPVSMSYYVGNLTGVAMAVGGGFLILVRKKLD